MRKGDEELVDLNAAKDLLRVSEVAAMLDVTQATVYRWIKAKRLKSVLLGSQLRIPSTEVSAFIGLPEMREEEVGTDPVEILEEVRRLVNDAIAELRERA